MSTFELLDAVETQIIRLGELTNLYNVIVNGMPTSQPEEILSSIQYIQGSLEDINMHLAVDFQILHNAVMKNENSDRNT
jgi:hypothetical protein